MTPRSIATLRIILRVILRMLVARVLARAASVLPALLCLPSINTVVLKKATNSPVVILSP